LAIFAADRDTPNERHDMRDDPFAQYRKSGPSFNAVTAADGRGLTLTAKDMAAFHGTAHAVIALANQHGWRVAQLRHTHPGANIASLTITPSR
jgi:hypothetical protein